MLICTENSWKKYTQLQKICKAWVSEWVSEVAQLCPTIFCTCKHRNSFNSIYFYSSFFFFLTKYRLIICILICNLPCLLKTAWHLSFHVSTGRPILFCLIVAYCSVVSYNTMMMHPWRGNSEPQERRECK